MGTHIFRFIRCIFANTKIVINKLWPNIAPWGVEFMAISNTCIIAGLSACTQDWFACLMSVMLFNDSRICREGRLGAFDSVGVFNSRQTLWENLLCCWRYRPEPSLKIRLFLRLPRLICSSTVTGFAFREFPSRFGATAVRGHQLRFP